MKRNMISKNRPSIIKKLIKMIIIIYIIQFESQDSIKKKLPKVSVFLPIYNKELYLNRSINSIQKQTLKEIEIVAVNDCSTDHSLKSLKRLAKNDNRIKIINNDRNHGLLYSRAMGIINSSGEYIMNLDPDDLLEGKNNLAVLYHYLKKYNLDFLRFLHRRIPRNKHDINFCNRTDKMQLKILDGWITNKIIKKKLFVKAYNSFKKKIYLYKWNYHEDNVWSNLIYKYSNSNMILKKPIYLIMRNNGSLMATIKSNKIEIKNKFYRLETYLELNLVNIKSKKKDLIFFKHKIHDFKNKEFKKKILRLYFKYMNLMNKI
jgi:glycosyltransferase involved in cell wall biosynthesis